MEHDEQGKTNSGPSRREMLRRSALVGGTVVWMAPAVQTLAAPAFADVGSEAPENNSPAPSYTMLVLRCGSEPSPVTYQSYKIGQDGTVECGVNGGNGKSQTDAKSIIDAQLSGTGQTWATLIGHACVPITAQVTPGGLDVNHPGCTVVAWSVHDGAGNGCGKVSFGPLDQGFPPYSPTIGASQSQFPKPAVTTCP